ncbi:Hypothetical predicted protein [Paramuricea clavata]|uniref:Uncharacterized protein n=1 Tax=Paramuricea clavata TaxID=317549 RepID=A0A6S7INY1_PARCT|nr:Hypothetical predicted protein [Paramuricea clavata]
MVKVFISPNDVQDINLLSETRLEQRSRTPQKSFLKSSFAIRERWWKIAPTDKGIFVDARYFQLHDFDITKTLKDQWLDQVVKREDTVKAGYTQTEQIVRKVTEQQKEAVENKIQEVNENAAANVTVINAQAEAKSLRLVEDARNQGLELLYSTLNFENEQHKASFNYLRTLRNHKNIRLHVNFGNLISGPNTG